MGKHKFTFDNISRTGAYVWHQGRCVGMHDTEEGSPCCSCAVKFADITDDPKCLPCLRYNWNPENRDQKQLGKCPKHRWPSYVESKTFAIMKLGDEIAEEHEKEGVYFDD